MNARRLNDLLLNLYACPTEDQCWPEVMDRVCHELHARAPSSRSSPPDRNVSVRYGPSATRIRSWHASSTSATWVMR